MNACKQFLRIIGIRWPNKWYENYQLFAVQIYSLVKLTIHQHGGVVCAQYNELSSSRPMAISEAIVTRQQLL